MTVRRRRHYGASSLGFMGLTALLAVGAVNSQNNLLFAAFGLALGALLLSGVVGGTMIMGAWVEREPPTVGTVGEPMAIRYEVRNRSRALPAFAMTVAEVSGRGDGTTWRRHMPQPRAFAAYVPRRGAVHVDAVVVPTRRGVATFGGVRVESGFPFGLLKKSAVFSPERGEGLMRALIRPRPLAVSPAVVRQACAARSEGQAMAAGVGRSDEFFGLREYAPGDTLRQIAWRPSARTGTLVVRENVSPSPTRLWVVAALAPGGGAEVEERNERALSLAAGVIVEADRQGVDVGLVVMAPGGGVIAPRFGPAHVGRTLDALALAEAEGDGPMPAFPAGAMRDGVVVASAGEGAREAGPAHAVRLGAGVTG